MSLGAVTVILSDGLDGALYVAGAVLAAVVAIYAAKFVLRALTMPKWPRK